MELVLLDRKVDTTIMKLDDMCKVLQEMHDFKYEKRNKIGKATYAA